MTLTLREVERLRPEVAEALPASPSGPVLGALSQAAVLLVDGRPGWSSGMAHFLELEGFSVQTAPNGAGALSAVGTGSMVRIGPLSVVLLPAALGDHSGLSVFRALRSTSCLPVIMSVADEDEIDGVLALEAGVADLVTDRVRPRELAARIRAVLRRGESAGAHTGYAGPSHCVGPVQLDVELREAAFEGKSIELSRKEFDLLALLMARPGHVVTRSTCMDELWSGRSNPDSRTLDTHIKRLRKKVEPDPTHPRHIVTVRGIGYRFRA